MSEAPLLEYRGVEVIIESSSGVNVPLQGVDLMVRRNERVGLVGESGSGKSMSLRAAIGALPPGGKLVAGDVRWKGNSVQEFSESQMEDYRGGGAAMIYQDPVSALDPLMTVGAHLSAVYNANRKGRIDPPEEVALELLSELDFPNPADVLHRFPHQLSGGMAQRVNIAMAMICLPEIVLADEPTTGLDVTTQLQVLDALAAQVESHGAALLLVSHDLRVVERMSERIGVMYAGRVVEFGPHNEVIEEPLHPYSADLLACAALIPGLPAQSIAGQVPALTTRHLLCPYRERCSERLVVCDEVPPPKTLRSSGCHISLCHRSAIQGGK